MTDRFLPIDGVFDHYRDQLTGAVVVTRPGGDPAIVVADLEAEVEMAAAPTAADVKREAARRIAAIMSDYAQRNALALFAETAQDYGADPGGWPEELRALNAALRLKWDAIKAIRARSDEIEAMQPIPEDFREDGYWTA